MEVWKFIQKKLAAGKPVMLMYVLQSEGSSPGRMGFKMAVACDDEFCGTIGGGIMEFKLVEKAKAMLQQNKKKVLLQHQYHDKEKIKDQSGMICSGSQLNVFIPISINQKNTIEQIISSAKKYIQLSPLGLQLSNESTQGFQYVSETEWFYTEPINTQPVIHIIGGGHVGLALSELMKYLGFYIKLYDDRQDLNTITANSFADEIKRVQYENMGSFFEECNNDYVVIMTVGYRTDKIVLKQLIQHSFFYVGLLGSDNKINMLMEEMRLEGYSSQQLKNIHTPIGINIFSKTPKEIAVSIAAEIISVKNRDLPSGRK
ncbi:MAG: XdhC family protein [Ferruginibacter sp.]|nr:XdhC family protein [Bacteroidota bacterium]MBX2917995.1 XdhC family protein [Ferruginibacter sp.]MCC7379453.1 XdhC family protein [Chitinophagaceae bacterium]